MMIRKWLAVGIILLFVGTCIIPAIAQNTENSPSTSRGNWLYVGGTGPGNYTRIQNAIDNASDGNTVFVYDDSSPYMEHLWINSSIQLVGENVETTVIDGQYYHRTIWSMATGVTVHGFTILGCLSFGGRSCFIENNCFKLENHENWAAINFFSGSYNIITNNIICNAECGIAVNDGTSNCTISQNTVISSKIGIYIRGHESPGSLYIAQFNIVENNSLIDNDLGIHLGDITENNLAYHNNVIGSVVSAVDYGYPGNDWVGNFWSDYTGNDSDGDGVGDTPYDIHSYGHDPTPAMRPVHCLSPLQLIYVNSDWADDSLWHLWDSIQDGVNDAQAGSLVFVFKGIYRESIVIDTILSFIGNRTGVIVDGCGAIGIMLQEQDILLKQCEVTNASVGIWIDRQIGCTVESCSIMNNSIGIQIFGNRTLIHKDVISDNSIGGIFLGNTTNEISIRNVVLSSNPIGILQSPFCTNCTIARNTISYSSTAGIYLQGADATMVIKENRISINHIGIRISSFAKRGRCAIFHNNFLNNNQQASDESNSSWDDGYPAGGNFWDDYVGSDSYSGVNQNIPGADAIGDIPYSIPGDSSQDRYPLMNPWTDIKIEILPNILLLGVKVRFTYVGPEENRYVHWTIIAHGGLYSQINKTIHDEGFLNRDKPVIFQGLFWGIGPITISVTAEESMKNTSGIQFLCFTFVRAS
jgi:parallel beta-helix repeat protein